jgi:hypothetical protein
VRKEHLVQAGASAERRERAAQRDAVDRVLPPPGEGAILRTAEGEILVYDEGIAKSRPIELRAVVMPDGETVEFETGRFRRDR